MTRTVVRIGARGSRLSRCQTQLVVELLAGAHPGLRVEIVTISTVGDQRLDTPLPLIGGKGVFTEEIEMALLEGRIDFAVHSLKDLPVENRPGIVIGAVPERAAVDDVLISRDGQTLTGLPHGAVAGTSSPRRSAQLLRARPDLVTRSIRGNVETRIRKAMDHDEGYDAIVLAKAGLDRLDLDVEVESLPLDTMLPAPGQGALAVQCRDDAASIELLAAINHDETEWATVAERAFLAGLGGGCSTPVAAYGWFTGGDLNVRGRVTSLDGASQVDVTLTGPCTSRCAAKRIGGKLAQEALFAGASDLIGAMT